ncbi:ATP-dependent DNA helicase RecG, partial [Durusdinium trenchii]
MKNPAPDPHEGHTKIPQVDDAFVDKVLSVPESIHFECKRIGKVDRLLESVVAFSNSDGGLIALGIEDPSKAQGRERVYGIQTHPMNWDELRRKIRSRITESEYLNYRYREIGCTLRDGAPGSIMLLRIERSTRVHSIVDDGTFIRLSKGNREIPASEITELCYSRGVVSAETQLEEVDFELLDTQYWRAYARQRKLTRAIEDAMYHTGLAKRNDKNQLRPTRAAVLLFAEDPSGLLGSKAAIRIFHYKGTDTATAPNTNLVRKPLTIGGPLIQQIPEARDAVINELAESVQFGPLGFEIVQKYPVRVITEAITNAVIHRDYRLTADTMIRIFSDRIEIESPGLLPGSVTVSNIQHVRHNRNPLITQHLREFPNPPNLDAHEGVRMMFGTMQEAGLYPPLYITRPRIQREALVVQLRNQNRPTVWEQVSDYLDKNGTIANAQVRRLMGTDDTL